MPKNRVLLAYSGGLDTSAIIPWLIENENAEVIAYCSDLGNSPDFKFLDERARTLGAVEFIFEDLREHFAQQFVFPAIRAGATYQDDYLLGTAIGRPLITERMAHFALKYGCTAVAHGATGKGNDQLRFEKSLAYLVPQLRIIAPWKTWNFKGRQDLIDYLKDRGFDFDFKQNRYSEDVNLMHRSCEGGILEEVGKPYVAEEVYKWITPPSQVTGEPIAVSITLKDGLPTALNGATMDAASLLGTLNKIAGTAGIGVVDLVEERVMGIKSRGIYETPGGTLLHIATRAMKHLCWDRGLLNTARMIGQSYGELIYDGLWHTEARDAAEAYCTAASRTLTGTITLQLECGQVRVLSRQSPFSLYDEQSVSFEADEHNMHHLADGYSRITRFSQWRAGDRARRTGIGATVSNPTPSKQEVKKNAQRPNNVAQLRTV